MLALPLLILQGHYSPPRELSSIPPPFCSEDLPSIWPVLSIISIQPTAHCHSLDLTTQVLHPSFVTMPFSLVSLPYVVRLLFVASCCTVCYFLPHAMQFALCCHMPCSLLLVAACCAICYLFPCAMQLLFAASCRAVCYLLPCAIQFAIFVASCRAVCYLLPHAVQFAICYHLPYSLLFVA